MKRFLTFVETEPYAKELMGGFVGDFDTIEEAKTHLKSLEVPPCMYNMGAGIGIVDTLTEMVYSGSVVDNQIVYSELSTLQEDMEENFKHIN